METWASVIKFNFYKILMAKIAIKDLKLEQMNVVIPYLYRHLDKNETIYVELPVGYLTNGKDCVALLHLFFYGLTHRAKI